MCTDCFNGCAGTTPDKCVKYTSVDVPELNIQNGDSLFSVEDNIILKILSIIIGEGILPEIAPEDICLQVSANLPGIAPYNLNDYLTAIIKTICDNAASIEDIETVLTELNSDYILDCITGVAPADIANTHIVVQAIIDNLCLLSQTVEALALDLSTNYVAIADLDGYIEAYLDANVPSTLINNKMIPYVAVEYYGTLANFNASGAGIGDWVKVYLCNGANGTPDKRGVTPVGVTTVTGGGAYNPRVDPGIPGNPNYAINSGISGNNTVTLTTAQIPPHTHTATAIVTDPGHHHTYDRTKYDVRSDFGSAEKNVQPTFDVINTSNSVTGITVAVTNSNAGSGQAHSNIQPVLPCYYIMYIP